MGSPLLSTPPPGAAVGLVDGYDLDDRDDHGDGHLDSLGIGKVSCGVVLSSGRSVTAF